MARLSLDVVSLPHLSAIPHVPAWLVLLARGVALFVVASSALILLLYESTSSVLLVRGYVLSGTVALTQYVSALLPNPDDSSLGSLLIV